MLLYEHCPLAIVHVNITIGLKVIYGFFWVYGTLEIVAPSLKSGNMYLNHIKIFVREKAYENGLKWWFII